MLQVYVEGGSIFSLQGVDAVPVLYFEWSGPSRLPERLVSRPIVSNQLVVLQYYCSSRTRHQQKNKKETNAFFSNPLPFRA